MKTKMSHFPSNPLGAFAKRIILPLMLLLATGTMADAQDAAAPNTPSPFGPLLPYYLVLLFMVVIAVLILVVGAYSIKVLNILSRQAEEARAKKLGVEYKPRISWAEQMWDQLNASVPVAQEEKIDLGHDFDGIRELDNHLPPWWKGLFYGSIVWAVIYLVAYHVTSNLPLSVGEYEQEVSQAAEEARVLRASRPVEQIDEASLVYDANVERIGKGKTVFTSNNCGSCHRNDGGGNNIGPNLTDEYWLHGGSIQNVFSTINKGVVEKGMPAWGKAMSPSDVRDVAFYVMSLQGSKPENGKAPQGDQYKPETKQSPADTTKTAKSTGTP